MDTCQLKIFNGKILTPTQIIPAGTLLVNNGIIEAVSDTNIDTVATVEIDAKGQYVSPGFIDLHVHGGGGHDFMDNTMEAFLGVAKMHARHGTTAMYPTTLSCEKEDLIETLNVYEQACKINKDGAQFLGLHIEGPYFSPNQAGAQDPRYIRGFDEAEYMGLVSRYPGIKRWSAAPELEGAVAFGQYMLSKNVLPAIAHSDAVYEEVMEAFENGFTHVTHFYSCTSGVTRRNAKRYAGIIETAYLIDDMTVEIIADGMHLPAALLKLIYKIKGADKTALITDAMRAAGMPEGESILGSKKNGLKVIVEEGVAKLTDRSAFAGSVATADELVRNMITLADVSLNDAVKMMTATPASIMKVKDKGALEKGKDADIVIFDETINIQTTIIKGKIVYSA